MAFVIKEEPTNHYLICTEVFNRYIFGKFNKIGKKINCWYPNLSIAVKFETIEEALEIFNKLEENPKYSSAYKIIDLDYEF